LEQVNKDGPALGLTISDNGAGFAFIKKIRDDSIMSKADGVVVGARLVAINGTALNGARHFEVARMLKEIPIGEYPIRFCSFGQVDLTVSFLRLARVCLPCTPVLTCITSRWMKPPNHL
jgi:hypothetical protein